MLKPTDNQILRRLFLTLGGLIILVVWLATAALKCNGVLAIRAWPPGWACVERYGANR